MTVDENQENVGEKSNGDVSESVKELFRETMVEDLAKFKAGLGSGTEPPTLVGHCIVIVNNMPDLIPPRNDAHGMMGNNQFTSLINVPQRQRTLSKNGRGGMKGKGVCVNKIMRASAGRLTWKE